MTIGDAVVGKLRADGQMVIIGPAGASHQVRLWLCQKPDGSTVVRREDWLQEVSDAA